MERQIGVEEEFLLVDRSGADLGAAGAEVTAAAATKSDAQFEHELKLEQTELGCPPQRDLLLLERGVRDGRRALVDSAREHGVALAALATSPVRSSATPTPDERYRRMSDLFGEITDSALSCGMHLHIDVASLEEGVGVLDRIRIWLPVLLALSANSPFLRGRDTAYASYRALLWRQWPTAGSTELFGDHAGYERARTDLIETGAAMDDGMIYFDARLSARYPTVELRVTDVCPLVEDAVTIAGLARALVETAASEWASDRPAPVVRTEIVRAASWRAARFGVTGELVALPTATPQPAASVIADLLERVGPALGADADRITDGIATILDRGTGADRQRAVFDRTGSYAAVVRDIVAATAS